MSERSNNEYHVEKKDYRQFGGAASKLGEESWRLHSWKYDHKYRYIIGMFVRVRNGGDEVREAGGRVVNIQLGIPKNWVYPSDSRAEDRARRQHHDTGVRDGKASGSGDGTVCPVLDDGGDRVE